MVRSRIARRGAFTLIELLVVISILSLLISILLPALSGARDSARRVLCMSNLRQIGQTMHTYAVDENDGLPLVLRRRTDETIRDPWYTPYTHRTDSNTYVRETVGLGVYSAAGYVTTPDMYYCPEQPHADYRIDGPLNDVDPWPSGGNRVRGSYNYNYYIDGNQKQLYHKLSHVPQDRSLVMDVVNREGQVAHERSESATWHLLYPDGHAVGARSSDVWTMLFSDPGNDWGRFNAALDILHGN